MLSLRLFYQPYKWLIGIPFMLLNTVLMGGFCLLLCMINGRLAGRWAARPWARLNMLATPASVKISGENNLVPGQSYVVVSNHLSLVDIFVLYGWLNLDLKWVMKKELRTVPVIGPCCAAMGHIFIDRSDRKAAMQTLLAAKDSFTEGESVLFFPEGTRSRGGVMLPFKAGAFVMAKDLGLPILPVTIDGSHKILPSDTLDFSPGSVEMIIHPAISAEVVANSEVEEIMAKAQGVISAGLGKESPVLVMNESV